MAFDTLNITVAGCSREDIEESAWVIAGRYYDGQEHFVHYTSDARFDHNAFVVDFTFKDEEPK